ncbi:MAG: type II toxin-antitoxin system RelE/ParE family toxin [Thermodesulfobacteriota bacterium]
MKLQWSETAKNDLISIRNFIAEDDVTAAKNWIGLLRAKASNIVQQPLAGRKVPELSRDDIREVIERNYRIVYQIHSDRISILTVFESHRLFPVQKI